MGFRTGAGGFVTITKNATEQLADPYAVAKWAVAKEYEVDDIVFTSDTGDGNVVFWRAKVAHTSVAGDTATAAANNAAAKLAPARWDELLVGTLYGLSSWTLTRSVTERTRRLLIEDAPRVTYGEGAATLQMTFLDNFQGSPLQRALAVPNNDVYVRLYPTGKGTGKEVIEGNMRVGESSHVSGDGDTDITRTVTLAADGEFASSAQS